MTSVTRRELFTLAAGALVPRQDQPQAAKHERPWSARARELEPVEGHWSDYAAWEEWMRKNMAEFYGPDSCWAPDAAFEDMPIAERAPFYCLMCDLCESAPPA